MNNDGEIANKEEAFAFLCVKQRQKMKQERKYFFAFVRRSKRYVGKFSTKNEIQFWYCGKEMEKTLYDYGERER